jgi:Protein kinase domain
MWHSPRRFWRLLLQRSESFQQDYGSAATLRLSVGVVLSLGVFNEWDRRRRRRRQQAIENTSSTVQSFHAPLNDSERCRLPLCADLATARCESFSAPPSSLPEHHHQQHRLPSVGSQLKQKQQHRHMLRTRQTLRKMEQDSSAERLADRYTVNWAEPLGEGSFGVVYLGFDKRSGDAVAVKKISKAHTGVEALQLEIRALLHLRDSGGHPNICSLREHFSEDDGYYYLILDLVVGGELFDHLVAQGAYSEADAARLVREVASALAFLHGGPGLIHGDLKPENLMLSSSNPSDAVIKVIDFGCAVIMNDQDGDLDDDPKFSTINATACPAPTPAPVLLHGRTLAYSPPEILSQSVTKVEPSVDMWALGTCAETTWSTMDSWFGAGLLTRHVSQVPFSMSCLPAFILMTSPGRPLMRKSGPTFCKANLHRSATRL